MEHFFWFFILYSFLGFLLEIVFSRAMGNPKRDRKCFLFLPLCPVYGLGAVGLLLLPGAILSRPVLFFFCGILVTTALEYLTGLFYEVVTSVRFWDYSHLKWSLGGKVCLRFSCFWGALSVLFFYGLHPLLAEVPDLLPPALLLPALLLFGLDSVLTALILRRAGSTDALMWYRRLPLLLKKPLPRPIR